MLATELLWSFEQIDKAPWNYVSDLIKYWGKMPPWSKLSNMMSSALGFKLVSSFEATDFEKQIEAKAPKHNIDRAPAHIQELLKEVRDGKYKNAGRKR
jgi:hypothetical protein